MVQVRGRSPLLPESLLIGSVSATEMFQFAGYIQGNFFWASNGGGQGLSPNIDTAASLRSAAVPE